jgi:hypothetical protein
MAGVLMFFKLYNEGRLLPAGLSFYLFQLAAYLICVYRQQIHADRNILAFGAQTVMFPKLLSGPLMEPASLQEQVKKPNISMQNIHDGLQQLINENPNRTVFFPDGIYLLKKPICTPADPEKSVDLQLSNFAQFLAAEDWDSEEAMIRLGGQEPCNNIRMPGSNYGLQGGIINGNGKAKAISIDSGRETGIRNVSIKNTRVGIHIKWGANFRSSDADIHSVNIVGNNRADSIGVWLEGHDNSLTNMRIASVHTGILADSGGNIFRNLHPLYIFEGENASDENYLTSVAFDDRWNDNYYDICYSDQFCTAFSMQSSSRNIYDKSYVMWYTERGGEETVFRVNGRFESVVRTPRVNFKSSTANTLLTVSEAGGSGLIENPMLNHASYLTDEGHLPYLVGRIVAPD